MRQVIVGPERINPRFLDFTRHHGFEVKRCRPYRPRTKGKVERSVAYLRDSFLNGRTFTGLDDLNAQSRHLLGTVANIRVHATTRARPCDRLLEETLTPCTGLNAYQVARSTARTVGVEALVRFEKSDYSVAARWLGTRVSVDAVATGPGQRIEAPAHVRERWARSVPDPVSRPPKGCHVTFTESVQVRPLSVYVEVAS